MRDASSTDFFVDVPAIGRFSFARRTPREIYKIRANYNTLTEGYEDKKGNLETGAFMFSTLDVLMVSAPDGFDLDKLDPVMDDNWEDTVIDVFRALRAKELSFRPKPAEPVQRESAVDVEHVPTEVPAPVQPAAN